MVNIEGVIVGNNRTSLSGNDLNRQFKDPDKYVHPEIYHFKTMVETYIA